MSPKDTYSVEIKELDKGLQNVRVGRFRQELSQQLLANSGACLEENGQTNRIVQTLDHIVCYLIK